MALALAAPAQAQAQTQPQAQAQAQAAMPDARTLALAAGWKALFLCSGLFVAGLDKASVEASVEARVEATDLQGAYPEQRLRRLASPSTNCCCPPA